MITNTIVSIHHCRKWTVAGHSQFPCIETDLHSFNAETLPCSPLQVQMIGKSYQMAGGYAETSGDGLEYRSERCAMTRIRFNCLKKNWDGCVKFNLGIQHRQTFWYTYIFACIAAFGHTLTIFSVSSLQAVIKTMRLCLYI